MASTRQANAHSAATEKSNVPGEPFEGNNDEKGTKRRNWKESMGSQYRLVQSSYSKITQFETSQGLFSRDSLV